MSFEWSSFVVVTGFVTAVFFAAFLVFLVPARLRPVPAFPRPHRPTAHSHPAHAPAAHTPATHTLVRKLCRPGDYDEWFRGITACLEAMGAGEQFFVDEPCRRNDEDNHITVYRPLGERAGDHPPSSGQLVPSLGMAPTLARRHMDVNWRRWRDAELIARSALRRTVEEDLFEHVKDLWCVKDMYHALHVALFPDRNDASRAHDLYRHLRGMRLDDGASAIDMVIHLNQFRGIAKAHGKWGRPLSATSKESIFRNSLQGDTRVQVEAALADKLRANPNCPPKTKWRTLKYVFGKHLERNRSFMAMMPGHMPAFDSSE